MLNFSAIGTYNIQVVRNKDLLQHILEVQSVQIIDNYQPLNYRIFLQRFPAHSQHETVPFAHQVKKSLPQTTIFLLKCIPSFILQTVYFNCTIANACTYNT